MYGGGGIFYIDIYIYTRAYTQICSQRRRAMEDEDEVEEEMEKGQGLIFAGTRNF